MDNSKKLRKGQKRSLAVCFVAALLFYSSALQGQVNTSVTGKVVEASSSMPVPYATIGLFLVSDGTAQLIRGTITDETGSFTISQAEGGNFTLRVSSVGYKTWRRDFEISDSGIVDAGLISLQDSTLLLSEASVVGERLKGKSVNGKTVYYMSRTIVEASGNAPDMLKHIPGIQVDLKQNISLDGKRDILIYVNGIERDKSYVSQLNPAQVDRVEIMNAPPSRYDGQVSGVIHIILKREDDSGFSGHFFSEIPVSDAFIYSFPAFSLQYGSGRYNLFASYSGEINYENIDEAYSRQIRRDDQTIGISSVEHVRQRNLSHKFHYGLDYQLTPRGSLSYYGSVNPYSYEQDGRVVLEVTGNEFRNWNAVRDESDKNLNLFNSVHFLHRFDEQGRRVAVEFSNSFLRADNRISYTGVATDTTLLNTEKPEQFSTNAKADYDHPLGENILLSTGMKARIQSMRNGTAGSFRFSEQVFALYGTVQYKKQQYTMEFGLRAEYSENELKSQFRKTALSLLPYASFQYTLNERQNLLFSFRRSVNRPSVFHLNPYLYADNPYAIRRGNPLLEPEFRQRLYAEHSLRVHSSFISYRLFYENVTQAIQSLTRLNESRVFESQLHNSGSIHNYGIQFLGSIKFGPFSVNPSVRLYNQSIRGNSQARYYKVEDRENLVVETGFSSILSFPYDFAFTATFQYATVQHGIQQSTFCDALYLFTLDKTFRKNLKVGMMTALPFAGTFVYHASDMDSGDISASYRGNLKLPVVPFMFRLSYQFHTGKEKARIDVSKDDMPRRPKSGF